MIIIDDYENGSIRAGWCPEDFRELSDYEERCLEEFVDNAPDDNLRGALHCTDNGRDFYIQGIDESELIKYLTDRNCMNYITAV